MSRGNTAYLVVNPCTVALYLVVSTQRRAEPKLIEHMFVCRLAEPSFSKKSDCGSRARQNATTSLCWSHGSHQTFSTTAKFGARPARDAKRLCSMGLFIGSCVGPNSFVCKVDSSYGLIASKIEAAESLQTSFEDRTMPISRRLQLLRGHKR
jgi:hypothetical protein